MENRTAAAHEHITVKDEASDLGNASYDLSNLHKWWGSAGLQ